MSSPLHPEIAAIPTATIPIPMKGVGIKGELTPFCQKVLHDSKGEEITTNIFASITIPATSERVMFFGDENKRWLGVVNEDGTVLQGRRLSQDGHASLRMQDREDGAIVVLTRADKASDGYSWVLRVNQGRGSKASPQVTLAEGAEYVKNPVSYTERKYKTERRRSIVKKLTGAAAVIATLSPGGLIDKAMDPVVDTAGVVREAGHAVHSHTYTADDRFDGMNLKDYPDILADLNREAEIQNAQVDKVANVAVQTMLDLDAHNYSAIQKRADEYVQRNPGNFMEPGSITTTREHIADATTNGEILTALRPLMNFYGLNVTINDAHGEVSVASSKAIANAIVNEIGTYPKTLVDKARLDTIVIDHLNTDEKNASIKGGDYNSYDEQIRINAFNDAVMTFTEVTGAIPVWGDLSGANSYEAVIAHEFGHALSGGRLSTEHRGNGPLDVVRDIAGALGNYPDVMSMYSRENGAERSAEEISGVLSDRADGLTHPDDSRRFVSPANKALLARLIRLGVAEQGDAPVDTGIIDYLVASNSRLMGRSLVGLGH